VLPAAALAAAVVGAAAAWVLRAPAEAPLRKFVLAHAGDAPPADVMLAPDGSALVYVQEGRLLLQDFGEVGTHELFSGRELGATCWSPDGAWIGFAGNDALWKVRRSGGAPTRLAPLTRDQRPASVGGAAWGEDGRIVFSSGKMGLWSASAQGGDVSVVAEAPEGIADVHEAGLLPGDEGWLVVLHGPESFDTVAALLTDGTRRDIVHLPGEQLFQPQWSPTGHVLYSRGGAAQGVYAVAVDRADWRPRGEPFLVAAGWSHPSVGADGTLAMIRGSGGLERRLALVDRTGTVVREVGPPGIWTRWPNLSPDGTRILAELTSGEARDLWLIDTERGSTQRITDEPGGEYWGTWSADGSEIYYAVGEGPDSMIRARPAGGVGEPRDVVLGWDAIPTPDGRWFLYSRLDSTKVDDEGDLWLFPLDGGEPRPFVATAAEENVAFPSPVDPFVAYVSDHSGLEEICLTTYPDVRGRWTVSVGGGEEPRWKGDGRELYYARGDTVMVVDVENAGGTPRLSPPRVLFVRPDAGRLQSGLPYSAHPSADGQLFAISLQIQDPKDDPGAIVVVQNWFKEFGER
jgi:Tol biopolymer transport system component